MAAARSRSLSVTVAPASWEVSVISTLFHEFDQSGWWLRDSARRATRVMNAKASEKSANSKVRRSAPSRSSHAPPDGMRRDYASARREQLVERAGTHSGALTDGGRRVVLGERRVAGSLQLVGDLGAARSHDLAAHEDVDAVGAQLGEQAVVMGD